MVDLVDCSKEITKVTPKLTLKKYVITDNRYAVMNATVKDKYDDTIGGGIVKFKVNGRTYSVNVKEVFQLKKSNLRQGHIMATVIAKY